MPANTSALVWFRRDLRSQDHAALYHALRQYAQVYCAFVFDSEILDALPQRQDRRVDFIHASVTALDQDLREHGGGLIVLHGAAREEIPALASRLKVQAVLCNRDYEPAAIARDTAVQAALGQQGVRFASFKDQVLFEQDEILTQTGKPYSVFTPYKNAHLKKLNDFYLRAYPVEKYLSHLARPAESRLPSLQEIGFSPSNLAQLRILPGSRGAQRVWDDFQARIEDYRQARDFPAVKGVSYLSVHLRFGTISIRQLARYAWQRGGPGAETWLSELIWRDFYQQTLFHHPHILTQAYRPEFNAIRWVQDEALFAAWCEGRTGYPLVDAGMRQLNQSGYMHNRLRMITASFLCKDLGIHWLQGERYFAALLNDYDLAANNGGWQWSASTGCDAQPWFRIFNPVTQSQKFDPQGKFIRRYLPELANVPDKFIHAPWLLPPIEQRARGVVIGEHYPAPVVDHALAREATLARFKAASDANPG